MNNNNHTLINLLSQNPTHLCFTKIIMGTLQLNSASILFSMNNSSKPPKSSHLSFPRIKKIRAVDTEAAADETPAVNFAFVSSVLLPDGTPDVHYRTSTGGHKLRDIMLDNQIELYGPYARPLLNCAGGGTCASCMVEVVEGRDLLSPRTDKEKEKLKRKPKNWRLACQTTVGKPDSRGLVVIQQLPEWKSHEWTYGKEPPEDQIIYV